MHSAQAIQNGLYARNSASVQRLPGFAPNHRLGRLSPCFAPAAAARALTPSKNSGWCCTRGVGAYPSPVQRCTIKGEPGCSGRSECPPSYSMLPGPSLAFNDS